METIKIISNPYTKQTSYQLLKEEGWGEINQKSRLWGEKFSMKFFPFKVGDIVSVILDEYKDADGRVKIVFEGNDDEYDDLVVTCQNDEYVNAVTLERSSKVIENAQDILPEIKNEFEKARAIFDSVVAIVRDADAKRPEIVFLDENALNREFERFIDASNDIIPICVLGNYSSGKSTFINALIGREILPSGAEPLTAKVYRLEQSKGSKDIVISFNCSEVETIIVFSEDGYQIVKGDTGHPLIIKVMSVLEEIKDKSIVERVNKALEVINISGKSFVSDWVGLQMAFHSGIWENSKKKFMIFDTPGSNSATHKDHSEVLQEAMENLSNGLLIFVSKVETLDSNDSEELYQKIKEIGAFDERFTMLIVNQADTTELPKNGPTAEFEQSIREQAVPKKLRSEELFFVSSVMGLGSKINGEFVNDHYAEIYDDQLNKYSNPSSRFYKMLYRYNIMPEQLKKRDQEAAEQCQELVFANSGLFSVEREIQVFAEKYSSYNKCNESQKILNRATDTMLRAIEYSKGLCGELWNQGVAMLEYDKAELLNKLKQWRDYLEAEKLRNYPSYMLFNINDADSLYSSDKIHGMESAIQSGWEKEKDFETREKELEESKGKIGLNFKQNIKEAWNQKSVAAFKRIGQGLAADFSEIKEQKDKLQETKKEISEETVSTMLEKINNDYKKYASEAQGRILYASTLYWQNQTQVVKESLAAVVTGSQALTDTKRDELESIIVSFDDIVFEPYKEVAFVKEEYTLGTFAKLFNGGMDGLKLEKLQRSYNMTLREYVFRVNSTVQASHANTFRIWLDRLLQSISENIDTLSPARKMKIEELRMEYDKIHRLEVGYDELMACQACVRSYMEWREV